MSAKNVKKGLIIDGNFILNKCVFSLFKDNLLYGALYKSLIDMYNSYRDLHIWDEVYFVSDSVKTSWRKNLLSEYKAHRTKSDDIDWDFVYTTYNEFKESIKNNSIILEKDGIEGDDWISYIVNAKNKQGYSFLIIASDHDIKQLITYSITFPNFYINMMSNEFMGKEKVYVPKNYDIFLSELEKYKSQDLFDLNSNGEFLDFIKSFLVKRIVSECVPIEVLITKMISGDSSDNIPSVFRKETKTGKMQGIGTTGAKTIYDKYLETFGGDPPDLVNDPDAFDNIADLICESKKVSYSLMPDIVEKLKFNRKIIDLNDLPDDVVNKMKESLSF